MGWNDEAAGWDDNPAVRAYATAAFAALAARLEAEGAALAGARVLDFGCGTGLLSVAMARAGAQVTALDPAPAMVAVLDAKGVPGVRTLAMSLDAAVDDGALAPGAFDLVTCSSVLAFVPDLGGTVAALVRLLGPGGRFVQWDWELDPTADEPYGLTRDAIAAALAAAGLQDIDVGVGFEQPFEGMVMAPLCGTGRVSSAGAPGVA